MEVKLPSRLPEALKSFFFLTRYGVLSVCQMNPGSKGVYFFIVIMSNLEDLSPQVDPIPRMNCVHQALSAQITLKGFKGFSSFLSEALSLNSKILEDVVFIVPFHFAEKKLQNE